MDAFQIFTVSGIGITAILGFYNLNLNFKNQRKSHRELIFQKQFEFFMLLQSLIARFEEKLMDINMDYSDLNEIQEKISDITDEIDLEINKNELIIPDPVYHQINDFSIYCSEISSLTYKEPTKINKEFKTQFIGKNVDLTFLMMDYIGIERLSDENRKLVRNKLNKI